MVRRAAGYGSWGPSGAWGLVLLLLACGQERIVLDPALRRPLVGDLRGGETHVYALQLVQGRYLALRIDQQGVDVVVTLFDPRRRQLVEVDNPSGADGARGSERMMWIAEMTGSHLIEIRAWGGESASGRYVITVEESRPVGPEDLARVDAEKTKAAGDVLYGQATRDASRRSIDEYQMALTAFQALGDDRRVADTRFRLGESWMRLDERNRAIQELETALQIYQVVDNRRQQAMTLHHLCYLFYYQRDKVDLALELCGRAVPLWQEVGDRRGLALSSNELGVLHRLLREDSRALEHYDRALELWQELEERREEAKTRHNRGRLYAALGDREQALKDLEKALEIRQELGQRRWIASTLNALGSIHARWQETEVAIRRYREALELSPEAGDLSTGYSLIGLGSAYVESAEEEARGYLQRSLEIFQKMGSPRGEARALLALGRLSTFRDCRPDSLGPLTRSLALHTSIGDRSGIAETLLATGGAERQCGEFHRARETLESALAQVEKLRARVSASGDQRAGFLATKQTYYEAYVDLLMKMHETSPAGGFAAEALAVAERARARSLIEALAERGDLRREVDSALLAAERSLERQIYAKQLQIEWLLESKVADLEAARRAEAEQQELLRKYEKLQGQIKLSSPHYASLARPEPLTAEDIQRRVLGPDTLLLEYSLGEDRSFLWAVTPDEINGYPLPGREEIEHAARFAYRLISREDDGQGAGSQLTVSRAPTARVLARLSRVLLGRVAAQIGEARRLLIVADGALQYLPFETLSLPAKGPAGSASAVPLIEAIDEIVYLPSASALAVLRDQIAGRETAPRMLAVLADPVYSLDDPRILASSVKPGQTRRASSFERLVHSGVEARAILDLVPEESRFEALGFDANLDVLTSGELGRHRLIHFATHGELNVEHGELSRLVLSLFDKQGESRDGFLYAYQVYGLELAAELAVLSACQTALGEQIRGEGLVGLTRGFMHAGAARVVVSLWGVPDQATADLMQHFYRELLVHRLSPAAALRSAKDSIRRQKGWQDPYYWAGFVLQGEWQDIRR